MWIRQNILFKKRLQSFLASTIIIWFLFFRISVWLEIPWRQSKEQQHSCKAWANCTATFTPLGFGSQLNEWVGCFYCICYQQDWLQRKMLLQIWQHWLLHWCKCSWWGCKGMQKQHFMNSASGITIPALIWRLSHLIWQQYHVWQQLQTAKAENAKQKEV